ncbi:MAG: hemerythrin domain-containing protein [Bacteroidota bacterium]
MQGPIARYLSDDHDRLDALLDRATKNPGAIDQEAYAQFRSGLLRHIGMEEKILLPAAARLRGGTPIPVADRIRLDHGAITALMVPPPDSEIIAALRSILRVHNDLEEQEGGVYQMCEQLAGSEGDKLLGQLKAMPEVPLLSHNPDPRVLEATQRAVERAGYSMKLRRSSHA